jgi:hypothetical protein
VRVLACAIEREVGFGDSDGRGSEETDWGMRQTGGRGRLGDETDRGNKTDRGKRQTGGDRPGETNRGKTQTGRRDRPREEMDDADHARMHTSYTFPKASTMI